MQTYGVIAEISDSAFKNAIGGGFNLKLLINQKKE
jgi:hypothetical protein